MEKTGKVRLDKWLWSVRVFKTRSLAAQACNSGKVKKDNAALKPSYSVQVNDIYTVQKGYVRYTYKVKNLLGKRVSAKLALDFLEDLTPEDELIKQKLVHDSVFYRKKGLGRPTKKERRDMDNFTKQ